MYVDEHMDVSKDASMLKKGNKSIPNDTSVIDQDNSINEYIQR